MASPAPTPISFRRDLRLFFAVLVGFLIVIIFALVLFELSLIGTLERQNAETRERLTDSAARELARIDEGASSLQLSSEIESLRARLGAASVTLQRRGAEPLVTGEPPGGRSASSSRGTRWGTLVVEFDLSELEAIRRSFYLTGAISLAAALLGSILLILYLPRITRPIEALLGHASEVRARDAAVDEPDYLVDTFRETIERMKAQERELRHLHEVEKSRADDLQRVTATLTRSLASGFISLDAAGTIYDMNAAAREILGIDPPAGASLAQALGPGPFTSLLASAHERREALSRREVEAGPGRTIGLTTVPLVNESGAFLGTLALFTDLTPIRTLETRLRELQTLADLGEISAGIAHEFRNSLGTILGYLTLARRQTDVEAAAAKVASAEEEANALLGAVEALLAFARPMKPALQPIDLRELAASVAARTRDHVEDVAVVAEGTPLQMEGDPALLGRALENLVRNAVESVRQRRRHDPAFGGGEVRIVTSANRLEVLDDGSGIDPAIEPKLFLPFQSTRPDGFGIGLPLTKKIVLMHEGTIRLRPREGGGAVAEVRFEGRS